MCQNPAGNDPLLAMPTQFRYIVAESYEICHKKFITFMQLYTPVQK